MAAHLSVEKGRCSITAWISSEDWRRAPSRRPLVTLCSLEGKKMQSIPGIFSCFFLCFS